MTLKTSFPVDCGVVVKGIFYFCNMITYRINCHVMMVGFIKLGLKGLFQTF